MSKKKKKKHPGGHKFYEPSDYRPVNCKNVPGERARKKCKKWNKFVAERSKLKKQGLFEEMKKLEEEYHGIDLTQETTVDTPDCLEEEELYYDGYLDEYRTWF
ncbi:MAG: hypothetical protein F6J98_18455 [Moorea sp. SIO4G2]|uniref:hypothetical protein n=2 Tax=Coleofasciculaceae TaxID=1892251 RepID=UPI0013C16014|nr:MULTISPECIES: hypothetical protein [unclassified Moorena]NEO42956.1 hypothetical protein [Moorena sp. SIO4A3]NEO62308.1 hypothetical protein [Moorena sp. SIO4G2]NEO17249.1 hypothetical protein [Moorena sp. SIO3E8]NEQ02658.1 hypothetical protein [Moorena sp. SIO3F7]NET63543.1 hypothetical protein [Moorena sp. SIO1G6]